jgi:hypothetical protein
MPHVTNCSKIADSQKTYYKFYRITNAEKQRQCRDIVAVFHCPLRLKSVVYFTHKNVNSNYFLD